MLVQDEQEEFDHAWADYGKTHTQILQQDDRQYTFAADNPFDSSPDAMGAAQEAFQKGSLTDACLALEAVVKRQPSTPSPYPVKPRMQKRSRPVAPSRMEARMLSKQSITLCGTERGRATSG
jgi:hypothetical protein